MSDGSDVQPRAWTCDHCHAEQTHDLLCEACDQPRFATHAIQIATHVSEHLDDGLTEPLEVLKAMQKRPCYARASKWGGFSLSFIARQMRLVTKDTRPRARAIAAARAAKMMLDVVEHGDAKDKIAVLKGIQVLGDVVEHKVDQTTRFVVETHPGPPPKAEGS